MTRLSDLNTQDQFSARVLSSQRLTPDSKEEIREIIISVEDENFNCEVDQSFGVLVEVSDQFGNHMHHRLYSVADVPKKNNGDLNIKMLVKRCSYVDEFSGEKHNGIASNYLCNRKAGDRITITGPFELPFAIPADRTANLILIGMGTGIAPFRAFIKHIYQEEEGWDGKVRLFYGANSGLELLYLNEEDGDLTQYYDRDTFKAFHSVSPRPHWKDPIALEQSIEDNADEIRDLLEQRNTYMYIAGYQKVREQLDNAMSVILDTKEEWDLRRAELIAGKKWAEILY